MPDGGDEEASNEDASDDDAPLSYPCSGSITLVTAADVAAAARCTAIGGALTIRNEELESVRLPRLGDAPLDVVELPALETAEVVGIGPTRVTQLVFPRLRWTDRGLSILDNPLLTSLELPAFEEIASGWTGANYDPTIGVEIERNAQLTSVKLPALYQLDGFLIVADNPSLRHVELPSLTRVAGDLQNTGTRASPRAMPKRSRVGSRLSPTTSTSPATPAPARDPRFSRGWLARPTCVANRRGRCRPGGRGRAGP